MIGFVEVPDAISPAWHEGWESMPPAGRCTPGTPSSTAWAG